MTTSSVHARGISQLNRRFQASRLQCDATDVENIEASRLPFSFAERSHADDRASRASRESVLLG